MIKNKYVSFEVAKLLTQVGFNYHEIFSDFARYYYSLDASDHRHESDFNNLPDNTWIPVPEQWQVVEWIKLIKNIWIYADSHEYGKWIYSVKELVPMPKHPMINSLGKLSIENFNSPEEAIESGILHTLKTL